ncbi:MAG: phosphoribosylformylglycinamidine synthase [Micavibrio aeruginosavorus]|uniref:Phosphoribosylformylglycinamidine synthase n=1 Tax=Micavibrio aeruginosavorus TaxID=349221 RepID=A0A2W5PZH3_9BACT|nr:MAG: phosphoribosylformylglycinamidine synthase [Micavibrio aeruginosavorus]
MTAKSLVLAGYGLNSEEETSFAFEQAGFKSAIRHINDLAENPNELNDIQVLCIPGGFSYGDDTGSGNAFAQKMRLTLWDHLKKFVERDTLTLGICNGCQIVANLGLAPAINKKYGERFVAVTHNLTARYQCRWIDVAVQDTKSPWLSGIDKMHIPVAHGEGRFMMDGSVLKTLQDMKQIALRFIKPDGARADGEFPFNPNGAMDDIAGMTDPTGRVLALMPHPERGMFTWQRDDYANLKDKARRDGKALSEQADGLQLFENAGVYFGAKASKLRA